jgi:hypothetical protein
MITNETENDYEGLLVRPRCWLSISPSHCAGKHYSEFKFTLGSYRNGPMASFEWHRSCWLVCSHIFYMHDFLHESSYAVRWPQTVERESK